MLTTDDARLAARLRRLREHGMSMSAADRHAAGGNQVEQYLEMGFNFSMTDIQAALGLIQLSRLDGLVAQRRDLAAVYHRLLADIPGVRAVADPEHGLTNYQTFWIQLGDEVCVSRDDVLADLAEAGISARRGIMAAHLEPAYAGHPCGPLPVTERLTARSLVLPLHHELTRDDQSRVVDALSAALTASVS